MIRFSLFAISVSLVAAACSSSEPAPVGHDTPERAVVSWFEAIDSGDVEAASASIDHTSLALILGIENSLPIESTVAYLAGGVPVEVQASYWESFAEGFREFASRPISTLTVGQANVFESEGEQFAVVPISGGPASDSVVISRMRADGSWEVDMVATLGDGFVTLLQSAFEGLPRGEDGDAVRTAYAETVVPSMWAAMADGTFGEDFARSALALIERIEQ
ncbi:MAG: hypothetical protein BMS9Abin17_1292 [Acidimicrobiia bacterium]|nr:MAG: hypothetical protein BMS9Abin17_1292 [Acidimicrobiia bacterium]